MRRSAAPSQSQSRKRQKITVESDESEQQCNKENNIKSTEEPSIVCQPLRKPSLFKTPVRNNLASQKENNTESTANSTQCDQYYNVMWGKMSKKKHKKWEGDGILVTKERTAILQDTEGKEIGKGRGYKVDELKMFSEGQTLCVGGKSVEIIGKISKESYLSGQCFQQSSSDQSAAPSSTQMKFALVKPFSNPQKSIVNTSSASVKISERCKTVVPRHDPHGPEALVMPRPSASHQLENNKKVATIVDVVVDPYVASVLRPHQREGVTFLYECVMGMRGFSGNGAILADDMGLGKTLQCITIVWTLYKQGVYGGLPAVKRILIVTPGSLVKNWEAEFRKWLGNERMPVYAVNSEKKVQEFMYSPIYPVMVISYEMFVRYIEDIKKIKFNLVICDEAHRLKNSTIKTTMHIMSLKIRRKILITGTPIQNDLTEFFSLAELCNPGTLGSLSSFRRVYEEPIVRGREPDAPRDDKELGERRANELNRLTSQFLLRRTSEINNKYLPKKVDSVVFCRPTDLQLTLYHHLVTSRWFRSCFSTSYAGSLHLMCIAALKKLCNHPNLLKKNSQNEDASVNHEVCQIYSSCLRILWYPSETLYDNIEIFYPADYDNANLIAHSGKLKVLGNLLRNIKTRVSTERVVVVSNYTQTLDIIQSLCEKSHYQFLRLDGQTATSKRQSLVERFNRKGSQDFVFLLSSKAGGVGLNLTGASILILFDIDWNPANDIQAMARVWRDGQKSQVKIYRLLTTGTIEEKIYQRQITKQGLSGTVADASASSKVEFSREDLKDLFTLHTKTSCLTHEMLNCSCTRYSEEEGDGNLSDCQIQNNPSSSATRTCQLGNTRETKEKNLSMAELMQWGHFSRPITETNLKDELLLSCSDNIDFIFQTETN